MQFMLIEMTLNFFLLYIFWFTVYYVSNVLLLETNIIQSKKQKKYQQPCTLLCVYSVRNLYISTRVNKRKCTKNARVPLYGVFSGD
jgi:hypothetical protein